MATDEFGRVIPAVSRPSQPPPEAAAAAHHAAPPVLGGPPAVGGGPPPSYHRESRLLGGPLSAPRGGGSDPRGREEDQSYNRGGGGGGGGGRPSSPLNRPLPPRGSGPRSPSPNNSNRRHHHHHHGGDRSSGGGSHRHHHHHSRERDSRDSGGHFSHHHHHNNNHHHHHSSHYGGNSRDGHFHHHNRGSIGGMNKEPHPSLLYSEQPMLCEYVWKDKQKKQPPLQKEAENDEGKADGTSDSNKQEDAEKSPKKIKLSASAERETDFKNDFKDDDSHSNSNSSNSHTDKEENDTNNNNDNKQEQQEGDSSGTYEEYRKSYCLRYIRSFFNHHLDDSWFRERYSPYHKRRVAVQERHRASNEARIFQTQLTQNVAEFCQQASLSGGIKGTAPINNSTQTTSTAESAEEPKNRVPVSHVFSVMNGLSNVQPHQQQQVLQIQDIPSYVTNEQIETALLEHCANAPSAPKDGKNSSKNNNNKNGDNNITGANKKPFEIFALPPQQQQRNNRLLRDAIVICYQPHLMQHLLTNLTASADRVRRGAAVAAAAAAAATTAPGEAGAATDAAATTAAAPVVVPRKDSSGNPVTAAGDPVIAPIPATSATSYHHHAKSNNNTSIDSIIVWLDLPVDASDPYGRMEHDADGKGGAPADGLVIPNRKTTLRIAKLMHTDVSTTATADATLQLQQKLLQQYQHVAVLSAALSARSRIPDDKTAAIQMARALDVRKDIPQKFRLDELLETPGILLSTYEQQQEVDDSGGGAAATLSLDNDERVLDIAIAYLRRVHLFSFYNGCAMADSFAEVLLKKNHPVGTIHLRLAVDKANTILSSSLALKTTTQSQQLETVKQEPSEGGVNLGKEDEDTAKVTTAEGGSEGGVGKGESQQDQSTRQQKDQTAKEEVKDLLVQRLDDSIAKALQECEKWIQNGKWVVDEETDKDAETIEQAEEDVSETWIKDHSMLDDDRRARCSFHFCHKLFKDESFLRKHLFKKHGEFLTAEKAKCHDEYMMKAWDAEEGRPVPDILVDCGNKFGMRPSAVSGREPDCVDPEPELWRKAEEKLQREEEMRQRRDEDRQARQNQQPTRSSAFVDVDDMKEEKVELSFDNVQIPPPVMTKKKKKRKLL